MISSGAGNDLVFGAYGVVNTLTPTVPIVPALQLPPLDPKLGGTLNFTAILTQNADLQGNPDNDFIDAGAGDDVAMGQQGRDTMYGGMGDDDLIGGSNVANAQDTGDILDGGTGTDVIAGDNATVWRRYDAFDPRFIALNAATIYNAAGDINSSLVMQKDPTGALHRDITLLDISSTTDATRFGNDSIAGGGGRRRDLRPAGRRQHPGRRLDRAQRRRHDHQPGLGLAGGRRLAAGDASVENAATDGHDYIEGGGGNDVIFGNLGQDDIIGGSSSLFGQTHAPACGPTPATSSSAAPARKSEPGRPRQRRGFHDRARSPTTPATPTRSWATTATSIRLVTASSGARTARLPDLRLRLDARHRLRPGQPDGAAVARLRCGSSRGPISCSTTRPASPRRATSAAPT